MARSRITLDGLPHSEISGSKPVCGSPGLIAAYHVLHRRPAPRHPPYALTSLTTTFTLLETVIGCRCPNNYRHVTPEGATLESLLVNEPGHLARWRRERHRSSLRFVGEDRALAFAREEFGRAA